MNINAISPVNGSERSLEQVEPSTAATIGQKEQQASEKKAAIPVQDAQDVQELAEGMNEAMNDLQTSIGFSIREELNHQVVVEIKDRKTNELIKQIPSEELLAIKEKMEEFTGLLFDQSV